MICAKILKLVTAINSNLEVYSKLLLKTFPSQSKTKVAYSSPERTTNVNHALFMRVDQFACLL